MIITGAGQPQQISSRQIRIFQITQWRRSRDGKSKSFGAAVAFGLGGIGGGDRTIQIDTAISFICNLEILSFALERSLHKKSLTGINYELFS
jgi:hypothetical protein